jgi:hypothetical protein
LGNSVDLFDFLRSLLSGNFYKLLKAFQESCKVLGFMVDWLANVLETVCDGRTLVEAGEWWEREEFWCVW